MRIGVFDSGLGGLAIARAIMTRLPEYDYLYLGDTKRLPYGGRSQETIHEFVGQALGYLFENDCHLVILACNTASAESLRKSQQEYLPKNYPGRNVLGVIIPTAEVATGSGGKVGVLATQSTVDSDAYGREIRKQDPDARVIQVPAPLLVPLIENDGFKYIDAVVEDYLAPLIREQIDVIVLGCTHYCLVKDQVRGRTSAQVISQDEIVPERLACYLRRHPEHERELGRSGERLYHVTDLTSGYRKFARTICGEDLPLETVTL